MDKKGIVELVQEELIKILIILLIIFILTYFIQFSTGNLASFQYKLKSDALLINSLFSFNSKAYSILALEKNVSNNVLDYSLNNNSFGIIFFKDGKVRAKNFYRIIQNKNKITELENEDSFKIIIYGRK